MAQSKPIRILYIEDDPRLARLVQKRLLRVGYVVDIASDGEEGLTKYQAGSYALLCVDQGLPTHDGLEVIRTFGSKGSLAPTLMVADTGDKRVAVEAMKLGVGDFIVKDTEEVYLELLPPVIEKLLRQRRAVEEKQRVEKELKESQQHYRTLVDNINLGINLIDAEYTILMTNAAQGKQFNKPTSEMIGKKCFREFEKRDDVCPHCPGVQAMATGQSAEIEIEGTEGDDNPYTARIQAFPIFGHDGNVTGFIEVTENITERKQMEEDLQESEERFRTLVETMKVGLSAIDTKGVHTYVNEHLSEMLGYSAHEIMGHPVVDFLNEENRKILKKQFSELKKGKREAYEITWVRKDGSRVTTILSPTPIFDTEGRFKGSYSFITDITERKKAEELLRQEKETFFTILQHALYGVALMQRDGKHVYVNPEFTAITGYTLEDIPTGRDWMHKAYPDKAYRQEVAKYWRKDSKLGGTRRVVSIVCKNGETKEIESSRTSLHNGLSVVMLMDVTERKRMEEELRESEKRFRLLVEHSADAFLLHDSIGKIIDVNQQACKSLGYTREELLGLSIQDIDVDVLSGKHEEKRKQMVPGNPITLEGVHKRKDGTTFPVEVRLGAFESGGRRLMLGLVRDITERKKMEEALKQATIEAETANRAKTEFLASMSHEIRTPMNAIIGMADLLLETELTPEQKQYVQVFQTAGENLLNIINDIIDISKVEAGHIQLETIDFDLNDFIEKICEIMAVRAHKKGLELVYNIMPDVPTDLLGDPTRLRQILVNLIGNAIKFTERGEVFIQIGNKALTQETVELLCSVRDSGIGMSAEQMATIFDPFTQADSSVTRKYGGTGLGLAISKQLVELMSGHITVKSKPGQGSTFSFTAQLGIQPEPQEHTQEATVDMKGVKVLVVDDNETNRMIVRNVLSKLGAIITEAESGERGLAEFKRAMKAGKPYQLALIDRRMPGMDGFELARHLKDSMGDIKNTALMMLTSDNRGNDFALCKELDIAFYLVKPLKKADLLDAIASIMGRKMGPVAGKIPETKPIDFSKVRPLNFLLVEDSADNRLIIQAYFKKTPYHIDIAGNGAIAVEKFKSGNYDLVLMDVQMPVMDGYTATREIRKWEREQGREETPIIALTASAMKEDVQKSRDAGCTDHLTKPIKRATLIEAVQKYTATTNNTYI